MAQAGTSTGGGEKTVFRTSLHPMSSAGSWGLAAFLLFVGVLIVRHNDLTRATNLRVLAGSVLLAGATLAGPMRRLRRAELVVSAATFRAQLGTWRRRSLDLPVSDVRRVDVVRTRLGKRLDFGTVSVLAADGLTVTIPHVRHAERLRQVLCRLARC
jgi:membrane protein YdbS with pleckstrin-like domain